MRQLFKGVRALHSTGVVAGALGLVLSTLSIQANATAAFARLTGASCTKCHTVAFPQLNANGERFMRNGFQMRKEQTDAVDLGGLDEGKAPAMETEKKVADDLILKRISEMFSINGKITAVQKVSHPSDTNGFADKVIGKPEELVLLASGTLYKDVPIWAEAEVTDDVVEKDRYFIGWTNVGGDTLANFRMGSIDPTTWTSFFGDSGGLDSAASHIGAYRGDNGFTKVGVGYDQAKSLEYYGYNDRFLWSAAVTNPGVDQNKLDYWLMGRMDILKGTSVSLLYYKSNNDTDENGLAVGDVYTLGGTWRGEQVDLRAQYSRDTSGTGGVDDRSGYTVQGDYRFMPKWQGTLRYDVTDNGQSNDAQEAQATVGLVFAPIQNVRITAAYVKELQQAALTGSPGGAPDYSGKNDVGSVKVRYMF